MAIIRQKSAEQQRREGRWIVLVVLLAVVAIGVGNAVGVDWATFLLGD